MRIGKPNGQYKGWDMMGAYPDNETIEIVSYQNGVKVTQLTDGNNWRIIDDRGFATIRIFGFNCPLCHNCKVDSFTELCEECEQFQAELKAKLTRPFANQNVRGI
jgi:hypothetical protein